MTQANSMDQRHRSEMTSMRVNQGEARYQNRSAEADARRRQEEQQFRERERLRRQQEAERRYRK